MDEEKAERIQLGQKWERRVREWLTGEEGRAVVHLEKHDEAPKIYMLSGNLISPDLLLIEKGRALFVEVKYKSSAFRSGFEDYTGVDYRHYCHYQEAAKQTGCPVYIFFVHGLECEVRFESLSVLVELHQKARHIYLEESKRILWRLSDLRKAGILVDGGGGESRKISLESGPLDL